MSRNRTLAPALLLLACAVPDLGAQTSGAPERVEGRPVGNMGAGVFFDHSSGEFGGTQSTEIWSLGVLGRYEFGPWVVRGSLPYVHVTGPGNVVPTGGGAGTPLCLGAGGAGSSGLRCAGSGSATTSSTRLREAGIGDVTLGLTYKAFDRSETAFDVTGKIKVPTADETRGLGTGEYDYSLQGDLYRSIGRANAFGTVGYRWYGDPAGIELEDVFFGAIGVTYPVAAAVRIGVAYDYRQPTYAGGASLDEISLTGSFGLSSSARLRGYVFKGLSDGGPDWGGGISAFMTF